MGPFFKADPPDPLTVHHTDISVSDRLGAILKRKSVNVFGIEEQKPLEEEVVQHSEREQ